MSQERILVFSAGANINKTYSVTAETYKPTRVYVMVEETVQQIAKDSNRKPEERKFKQDILDAIDDLKSIVEKEGRRTFEVLTLTELTQEYIEDEVIELKNKYPDAHFIFNITAGTALFSTTLFQMGIFLGADVCITRTSTDTPIQMAIPKMSLEELDEKPHLKNIIKILGEEYPKPLSNGVLMYKQGFKEVSSEGRFTKQVKSGDKSLQSKRMDELITKNLVEEVKAESEREKYYALTFSGRFVSRFLK